MCVLQAEYDADAGEVAGTGPFSEFDVVSIDFERQVRYSVVQRRFCHGRYVSSRSALVASMRVLWNVFQFRQAPFTHLNCLPEFLPGGTFIGI
jgi:hypothetical protein